MMNPSRLEIKRFRDGEIEILQSLNLSISQFPASHRRIEFYVI